MRRACFEVKNTAGPLCICLSKSHQKQDHGILVRLMTLVSETPRHGMTEPQSIALQRVLTSHYYCSGATSRLLPSRRYQAQVGTYFIVVSRHKDSKAKAAPYTSGLDMQSPQLLTSPCEKPFATVTLFLLAFWSSSKSGAYNSSYNGYAFFVYTDPPNPHGVTSNKCYTVQ